MKVSPQEIEMLIEHAQADKMLRVAIYGALSQIRHHSYLVSLGHEVTMNDSNNAGLPDFTIGSCSIEHKRARNQTYADGTPKVELQKTRASGKCRSNRFYDRGFCDVVAVDVSEHTGKTNDYRYASSQDLQAHKDYPGKLAVFHRIDHKWKTTLREALSESR